MTLKNAVVNMSSYFDQHSPQPEPATIFPPAGWVFDQAFDEVLFLQTEDEFQIKFPSDYVEFMKAYNGGEGKLLATYVMIWASQHIQISNSAYCIQKYLPDVISIGSDGGSVRFGIRFEEDKTEFVFFFLDDLDEKLVFPISDTFLGAMEELGRLNENEFEDLQRLLSKKSV